jgi:hypothetical protein
MKGMVFTEFTGLVETLFGANMVDDIMDDCDLASGGAYTNVGTYDYQEMIDLVSALSKRSGMAESDLYIAYGKHLFSRFHQMMPHFFKKPQNAFEFIQSVHDIIHVEVKKLNPDAELPSVIAEPIDERSMLVTYQSKKPFASFALGLIQGCIDHYQQPISISYEDKNTPEHTCRVFKLVKS